MTLRDLVRTEVATAATDTNVTDLANAMNEERVGSIVIVDEDRPIGIVTDRDLAMRVVGGEHDPNAMTASDVMTPDPATATMDTGLFELTELMEDATIRRVPVLENGSLAGIITLDDVHRLLVDELDNLCDVIEAESPPY